MKNKKGAKNQKFIAQVEKQVKSGNDPRLRKIEEERAAEKKRKEEAKKLEEEQKALFKPVMTQKVENGVDPKSVFCAFFKQGLCKKGDKCKFSHDPSVEHKSAKRSIYSDARDEKEDDNMEDWDDDKLADVVNQKHGAEKTNQTDIVIFVEYFLKTVFSRIFERFRFANTSWMPWKTTNTDGSGFAPMAAKTANTDMRCLLVLCSKK